MIPFEELKLNLKDKWLDYYEVNQLWIKVLMRSNKTSSVATPDRGIRPNSSFILGVVSGIEQELLEWIYPFCQLHPDRSKIVEALGLHFDPDKELEKRKKREVDATVSQDFEPNSSVTDADAEYLNKIRLNDNLRH